MRKKYLLGAAVSVLALAFAAMAFASPQFKQTDKVKYTKNKGKVSAGISTTLESTDPGAQPPGNQPAADKAVLKFKGAKVDSKGAPQCSSGKAQAAQCPSNSKVGTGSAEANIVGTNPTTGVTTVTPLHNLHVTAFNGKGKLYLLIKETGTLLKASLTKNGTLTTNVKRDTPPLPGGNKVVLTKFQLKTKAKSRKIHGKRHIMIRTPKCPKSKKWKISVAFTYSDGTSDKQTLTQKCKR
ncbi:MAG TPA: hypothetical protein VGF21_00450 [Thermoleophilaceae bacterium]